MEDVDNRGDYARLGAGDIWATFVPSTQFFFFFFYLPLNLAVNLGLL